MGCHLEHRIGRSVDDPLSSIQMLLAVIPDHIGAGVRQIAQAATAGGLLEGLQDVFRETVGVSGQRIGGY